MAFRYGNIKNVVTTGASMETANADGISYGGRDASREMARKDLRYVNRYQDRIISASKAQGVDPAVVAGIISRETRGGRGAGLRDGWGDHGNAFGLMQIDKRWHTPRGGWDSKEHIEQGIGIFKDSFHAIGKKFPGWTAEQKLKGALAAYNMGPGNVKSYEDVDAHTTGKDYSNDVSARAQFFKEQGY